MLNYLATHPSIFIIGITVFIIIIIFIYYKKKSTTEFQEEEIISSNQYIELQEYPEVTQRRPDEIDTSLTPTTPLPVPKLTKKLRYDGSQKQKKTAHVYDTPRVQHFAPIRETSVDESSSSFSYNPTEIINSEQSTSSPGTSGSQPVVYRETTQQNQDNRISVSDVYKHGSYISFDGEFDSFDEFRKSCVNTLRLTVDFGANNNNYIVPVIENEIEIVSNN